LNPSKGMLQTDSGFPDIIVCKKHFSIIKNFGYFNKNFKILGTKLIYVKLAYIVSINNDVMKIYIREKMTQKIQSILMDRNQEVYT
jgi:hypothetical protein